MNGVIENHIYRFIHCSKCIDSIPNGVSPREFANNEVGFLENGDMQVWCVRHEENIVLYNIKDMTIAVNDQDLINDEQLLKMREEK